MERSGNFRMFQKLLMFCSLDTENFNYDKLQMVYSLKHYLHNNPGLEYTFINLSCKASIFVLNISILDGLECQLLAVKIILKKVESQGNVSEKH